MQTSWVQILMVLNNQAWQWMELETEVGQRKQAVEEHRLGKWDSSARYCSAHWNEGVGSVWCSSTAESFGEHRLE